MTIRRWHKQVLVAALAACATVAMLLLSGASAAAPGRPYLALGDSVSFGFITQAGYQYRNPDNFIGFPTYVGQALGMTPTNASCPGETTEGFSSATRRGQRLPHVQGELPAPHELQRQLSSPSPRRS